MFVDQLAGCSPDEERSAPAEELKVCAPLSRHSTSFDDVNRTKRQSVCFFRLHVGLKYLFSEWSSWDALASAKREMALQFRERSIP